MIKKVLLIASVVLAQVAMAQTSTTVYFTNEISAESLVKIYKALGVTPQGKVAVKISTGESSQSNQLSPDLIKNLVREVNGTLVECNTAYSGNRSSTANHRRAIAQRGYDSIATVDIMDENGYIDIPVTDEKHLKFDRVGSNLANYNFMINLAHFKGHAMGGFGGVLKNQSIGVASRDGKAYIHSAGTNTSATRLWSNIADQDDFLESMAAAAQAVHNYFKAKEGGNVLYINVMNNLSVDCDCDGSPDAPQMHDIGILASLDPVALDKACLDLVFNHESTSDDNSAPLIARINRQHGTYIVDYAEQIGLGTKSYTLVDVDASAVDDNLADPETLRYNVYNLQGVKVLNNAQTLDGLDKGIYIVNGRKTVVK